MNYGGAIEAIKGGKKAFCESWKINGAHIRLEGGEIIWSSNDHPDQHYIPSQLDQLADDWNEAI